jgi:triphosphoribosyl-dephospho-CoA synthase
MQARPAGPPTLSLVRSRPRAADTFRPAFLHACALDVQVRKPGNVSVLSPGHGMSAADFLRSAEAAVEPLVAEGAGVGERIEGAVRATRALVHCNTNLGIVLLAAPLAAAWEREPEGDEPALRRSLDAVLATLDVDDARAAFRAIAHAQPAGLGDAPREDVHALPTLSLRDAMALAADRDRIAAQYAHRFADVRDAGLSAWREATAPGARPGRPGNPERAAVQRVYLEFLASALDSHIVRKHGPALAQSVMAEALPWRIRARAGEVLEDDPAFVAWDATLKARGLNPGTSADLTVAVALLAALLDRAATNRARNM